MCGHRARRGGLRLAGSDPHGLNHAIVSGRLTEGPRLGRNPAGEAVTVLRLEFPVLDPERPRTLWTWAGCEVEVPDALAERHGIRGLEGGAQVLVAGQLSERWALSEGRSIRRPAIVAVLVHPGERSDDLVLPGDSS